MSCTKEENIPMDGVSNEVHEDDHSSKKFNKAEKSANRTWKRLAIVFGLLLAMVLVALILVITLKSENKSGSNASLHSEGRCGEMPQLMDGELSKRSNSIYSGLTSSETNQIMAFLLEDEILKLVPIDNATLSNNYIYSIETYLPKKKCVTGWLDSKATDMPVRQARAILFMGETKKVLDYIIGPIPAPSYKRLAYVNRPQGKDLTWKSRPICEAVEEPLVIGTIWREFDPAVIPFMKSFILPSCKDPIDCIYMNMAARTVLNSPNRHLYTWFFAFDERVEDYYMYPVPLYVVVSASPDDRYRIEKIYYNNIKFNSVSELITRYNNDPDIRFRMPDISKNVGLYGSPRYIVDGITVDQEKRPPTPVYPDGQRFRVEGQYVEWLKWSFSIHSRTVTGGQLFDVRFDGKRIAYEMSMQDIIVVYAGDAPDNFFKSYFDNGWAIGQYNMPLIRNVDCPPGAVYLNSNVYAVSKDKSVELKDAYCVFEHRNSVPLRRHFSTEYLTRGYRYAFSMPDTVLVVRQILTVWNYDYIFDYEFHQNGMVEAKVTSTGYIAVSSASNAADIKRGYVVNQDLNARGNLHQHLFNFKLDVDVAGVHNRFKTVDIKSEEDATPFANVGQWSQMYMEENLVSTESQAAIRYDFDSPKYYVVQNFMETAGSTAQNISPRGYRVLVNGFSKVVLPDDSPLMAGGASWAKYQLAVTKQNDNERATSSYFVQADPFDPAVNFDSFVSNDDSLVDVDLVVWATVGLHHIPTYEDLPVTTTPGKTVGVALSPFNYYTRDPSIHSRDAVLLWNKDLFEMDNEYLTNSATCAANVSEPVINSG